MKENNISIEKKNITFDSYAEKYKEIHNKNVRIFGENTDYFLKVKVEILLEKLKTFGLISKKLKVLDIGCGIGRFEEQIHFKGINWDIYGIDISFNSLKVAKKSLSSPNFSFIRFDGDIFPFLDDSFDLVVAICVFHHILPEKRIKAIEEIHRVLKRGGYVFIFEHNPTNPLTRFIVNHCEFDKDSFLLSHREVKELFVSGSIVPILLEYFLFFPHFLRFLRPVEKKFLRKIFFGGQFYYIGRKT